MLVLAIDGAQCAGAALLRGQSEQARHALAENPQRLIELYVLVDVVDGARRHQATTAPMSLLVHGRGRARAVQVFFCKFREGDFSVVVITLSG